MEEGLIFTCSASVHRASHVPANIVYKPSMEGHGAPRINSYSYLNKNHKKLLWFISKCSPKASWTYWWVFRRKVWIIEAGYSPGDWSTDGFIAKYVVGMCAWERLAAGNFESFWNFLFSVFVGEIKIYIMHVWLFDHSVALYVLVPFIFLAFACDLIKTQ